VQRGLYAKLLELVPFHVTTAFVREDDEWKVAHQHGDVLASGQNGDVAQPLLSAPCGTLASDSAARQQGPSAGEADDNEDRSSRR
jgi:hypothetical protein